MSAAQWVIDVYALMLPLSVSLGGTPLLAGRWVARSGPAMPMFTGYLAIGLSLVGLVGLSPSTSPVLVGLLLFVLGTGNGLAIISTNASGLLAVPRPSYAVAFTDGLRLSGLIAGAVALVVAVLIGLVLVSAGVSRPGRAAAASAAPAEPVQSRRG